MKEVLVTEEGYEELKKKLNYLVTEKRMECAENIKKAREFGDLSENAEYEAAKNEQGFVEMEIKELEDKILHAVIIPDTNTHTVSVGNTVTIVEDGDDELLTLTIVGTVEANIDDGKISNESPLGKALIGKKKNGVAQVVTPNGSIIKYIVKDIK